MEVSLAGSDLSSGRWLPFFCGEFENFADPRGAGGNLWQFAFVNLLVRSRLPRNGFFVVSTESKTHRDRLE